MGRKVWKEAGGGGEKKSRERWERTYSGLEVQENLCEKVIFKNEEEPALGREGKVPRGLVGIGKSTERPEKEKHLGCRRNYVAAGIT